MGRKRTGTIYEKAGAFWYAFSLRSGKRYAKRVPDLPTGAAPSKEQARTYLNEVLRRYEMGLWDPEGPADVGAATPARMPTVAEYAERWSAALTHASAFNVRGWVRTRIAPTALGAMLLSDVRPRHVVEWIQALREMPSDKGGVLAPRTVSGIVAALKRMFIAAVFEEIIVTSPVVVPRGIAPARTDKAPGARRLWRSTSDEVVSLISSWDLPQERRVMWAVLLLAGLRLGELVVLRWSDIERRSPLSALVVSRAWDQHGKRIKSTKTGAVREVPIHTTLAAILSEWRLTGWAELIGRAPTADDWIFPMSTDPSRPRNTRVTQKQWSADRSALGLPPRRLHGARHTFISMCIDDGARSDLVRLVTHTRAVVNAFDAYRNESWSTLCAEVARLKIHRRDERHGPLFAGAQEAP